MRQRAGTPEVPPRVDVAAGSSTRRPAVLAIAASSVGGEPRKAARASADVERGPVELNYIRG